MTDENQASGPVDTAPQVDLPTAGNSLAPVEPETSSEEPKQESRTFNQDEVDDIVEKRLAKERRKAERETAKIAQKLQELEQRIPAAPVNAAPVRENFPDYESYIDARAEWKAEQKFAQLADSMEERSRQSNAEREHQAAVTAWETQAEKAIEAYPDFEKVAYAEDLPILPHMADAIRASERGADVLYHLGKNPDIAEKLSKMNPIRALVEMGKIEASLSNPKPVTKAPDPIKPVGNRSRGERTIYDDTDDVEGWIKRRNAEKNR